MITLAKEIDNAARSPMRVLLNGLDIFLKIPVWL